MISEPHERRRERLPNRRAAETRELRYGAKVGSDTDGLLADVGVLLSRLLQHGDTLEAIARGMARLGDGATPASIIGAALDRLTEDGPAAGANEGDER